jgi:3-phosphoshikimate 1-carboxyvinyltransferase
MIYKVQASPLINASIQLPASKSISNRILILNAISESPYPVVNLSGSDDTRVLSEALRLSGRDFNIGAAGTSMRFLTSYLSQLEGEWSITGTERMKNRPIGLLVEALRRLGAEIDYLEKEGFPPLRIRGKKLKGGSLSLDGGVSSQYISALMMIAPCLERGLDLHLEGNIISKPYIQMTVRLMELFGIQTVWEGQILQIRPQNYTPVPFQVESDWSAASYWYEIIALAKENSGIELQGLEQKSVQGDAAGANLFDRIGVQTIFTDKKAAGIRRKEIDERVLEYDFVNEPDLAQTFVVTCCLLDISFRFTGLQSLRIKETDRMVALQNEMQKLGYVINNELNSVLEWTGEKCEPEHQPVISTYEDHRMAMAFAPVCLKTKEIRIKEPEVVSKSYPAYWEDLRRAGFIITEEK